MAEARHRELLARTELDFEVPARARRADGPEAAGRIDIIERHARRVAPTPTPDDERGPAEGRGRAQRHSRQDAALPIGEYCFSDERVAQRATAKGALDICFISADAKIPPARFRWQAQHGRLPAAVKDGGRWFLDARELDKALAGGRSDVFRTSPAEGDR